MKIGYARVSTADQDLTFQIEELQRAGCERIYSDRASGARTDRPGFRHALDYIREGDVLVVWHTWSTVHIRWDMYSVGERESFLTTSGGNI
jgi:DNA invertase Pin-like site-specific DNA recombinase